MSELAKLALFGPEATNLDRFLALQECTLWPEAQAAESAAAQASPFGQWWAGGSSPMLVVQGLNDRTAPIGNGRALKEEFPDRVELVELPGFGHAVLFEGPEEVSAAVLRFLKAHPRVD
jgi:pimeloyl-ACP methyl ester carboxylesterase